MADEEASLSKEGLEGDDGHWGRLSCLCLCDADPLV